LAGLNSRRKAWVTTEAGASEADTLAGLPPTMGTFSGCMMVCKNIGLSKHKFVEVFSQFYIEPYESKKASIVVGVSIASKMSRCLE
jgi:hypothetical protein